MTLSQNPNRLIKLAEFIKRGNFSKAEVIQAFETHKAKAQVEDRLIGALNGWPDKEELFQIQDEISIRPSIAAVAKRITNWLFYNNLVNMTTLIENGKRYYLSQPESIEQPQANDERAVL